MKNSNTYEKWILEGYRYFSEVGPKAFSIKELSERSGLSRTSFHYYFESKEDFFDQLIDHHMEETRKFGALATKNRADVTQGIAQSMEAMSTGILFHMQLLLHRNIPYFNKAYLEGHSLNYENGILDWFLDFFHLKMTRKEGERAYLLFVDVLSSRLGYQLQTDNISLPISSLFYEVIRDFKKMLRAYSPPESPKRFENIS